MGCGWDTPFVTLHILYGGLVVEQKNRAPCSRIAALRSHFQYFSYLILHDATSIRIPLLWPISNLDVSPLTFPRTVTMDRSAGRTVFIYRATGDNKQLGGLVNTRGITNKNFHDMLEIILVFRSSYTLTLAGGYIVPKDGAPLQSGNYYVDGESQTLAHVALLICSRDL